MLESGDWVVPRLYDEIRAAKPPFIYWCQASAMRVVGQFGLDRILRYPQVFAARLPSALAMLSVLAILSAIIWKFLGPERAFWTALVLATSLLGIFSAKIGMTDAVLLLWITIAQLCIYAIWRHGGSWSAYVLLAIAVALGGLTKGFLILGVLGFTVLAVWGIGRLDAWLSRRKGRPPLTPSAAPPSISPVLRTVVALLIFTAIVLPWILMVNHREPSFLPKAIADARSHTQHGTEGHWFPPGYHLLLIWVTFFPWSLLLPFTLVSAWMNRAEPPVRFALAAAIGPWLLLEVIVQTKLPHYMLATFPALAYLTADAVVRSLGRSGAELKSTGIVGASSAIAMVMIAAGLLPWLAMRLFDALPYAVMVSISLAAIVIGVSIVALFSVKRPSAALALMGIGMLVLAALFFGFYLPRAQFLQLAPRTAAVLKREGVVHRGDAYMLDYKEPSLAFYQGGSIRESPRMKELVTRGYINDWTPWMVITRDVWNATPAATRARLQVIATFHGLAISDGMRDVELMVVRKIDVPPIAP